MNQLGTIRIQSIRERTADDQLPAPVEASPHQQSEPAKSSPTLPTKPDIATPAPAPPPPRATPQQPGVATVPELRPDTPAASKSEAAPPPRVQKPAVAAQRNSELLLPEEAVAASSSVAITSRRSIEVPVSAESHARQSVSNLVVGKPLTRTVPSYPSEAQQERVEGTVKLHAIIAANGTVESVEPVSGPPSLVDAAVTAIREWRFAPTKYDGRPVRAQDEITLFFRLPD